MSCKYRYRYYTEYMKITFEFINSTEKDIAIYTLTPTDILKEIRTFAIANKNNDYERKNGNGL